MEVNMLYVDMPCRIKGFSIKIEYNFYIIAINTKFNLEQQNETYLHELRHIENNDFDNDNIDLVELIAHGL